MGEEDDERRKSDEIDGHIIVETQTVTQARGHLCHSSRRQNNNPLCKESYIYSFYITVSICLLQVWCTEYKCVQKTLRNLR